MVYCNLKGGLANMLFQIAATKSLSIDKGLECSFPNLHDQLNYLNNEAYHNPSLNNTHEYLNLFKSIQSNKPNDILPVVYYPFEFMNKETPNCDFFIDGFFQSEKYFIHNIDEIRDFIKVDNNISDEIDNKYSNLLKTKTTSIHIRRGDYLKLNNSHNVLDIEYYKSAIEILFDNTDNFLIFSDDIEWCKLNITGDKMNYIEGEKDYIDLYLMSRCNNNIIANSSFSLWSCIMNNNSDKIVIAPKKWFGSSLNLNESDVLPKKSIKI